MANVVTKDELWAELDALGEEKVRANLAAKIYGDAGNKRAFVEEWLRKQERDREEAFNREQLAIARDAASAARDSADAARDAASEAREANSLASAANRLARNANTIASIAIAVAAIAAITAAISLFLRSGD